MEELKEKAADMVDHMEDLADTFYKLTIINVTQKATNIASGAVMMIVASILSLFIFLFLGIALSWWLGDLLHSRVGGFLLGAAFYAIALFILLAMRKTIVFPFIRNRVIRKVYD